MSGVYRKFDGMVWPVPGDGLDFVDWSLRYGDANSVRLVAASVVSAYSELIGKSRDRREAIVKELRLGSNIATAAEKEEGK